MSMGSCERAVLLADCLELGRFRHANGRKSNNKLNLDHLHEHAHHLQTVLLQLGNIALRYSPDLLVGVPSGGTFLADKLTDDGYLNIPAARLSKESDEFGLKTFTYDSDEDMDLITSAERIVVVEDVFNKFTSTLGVLALAGIKQSAVAVVGIWDRGGDHPSRLSPAVPAHALVSRYIPNFLHESDEIFEYGVQADD